MESFENIRTTKHVNLSEYGFTKYDLGKFNGLEAAKIDLSHNQISRFASNQMLNLKYLEELDLSYNKLEFIDLSLFQHLNTLMILDLSNNPLKYIKNELSLPYLVQFRVDFDQLDESSKEIANRIISKKSIEKFFDSNERNSSLRERFLFTSKRILNNVNNNEHEDIYLISKEILCLDVNAFSEVKDVKSIYLSRNFLFEMHPLTFGELTNLEHLNLSFNSIRSLPKEIFNGLPNLKTVYLFNNKLESIHPDLFRNQSKLEELDLSNNMLYEFESKVLEKQFNLQSLNLAFNSITRLDSKLFKHKYKLKAVNLSNNTLNSIDGLFSHSIYIEMLDLNNNQLSSLKQDALENLSNLSILNLANNQIKTFDAHFFKRLSNLAELNLANNHLKSLNASWFQALKRLKIFNLQFNQLKSFDVSILNDLPELNTINLSNNKLGKVYLDQYRPIQESSIRSVDMSHNQIKLLNGSMSAFRSVEFIGLEDNLIQHLPLDFFNNLLCLTKLNLSNNHLTQLDKNMFLSLPKLFDLNLSENDFNLLELDFNLVSNIEVPQECDIHIELSNNRRKPWFKFYLMNQMRACVSLNGSFIGRGLITNIITCSKEANSDHLPKIYNKLDSQNLSVYIEPNQNGAKLNASNIHFEEASLILDSNTFSNSTNLVSINLTSNKIAHLEANLFDCLVNLEELYLSKNDLIYLETDLFKRLEKLIILNLSQNKLKKLDKNQFRHLKQLKYLDLSSNQLACLDSSIFQNLSNLSEIQLNYNNFASEKLELILEKSVEFISYRDLNHVNDISCVRSPMIGAFKLKELISSGAFGEIYRVKDEKAKIYAIKKIPLKILENYSEIMLLKDLKNDYIIGYLSCFYSSSDLCIVTKYYPEGNLTNQIKLKKEDKAYFQLKLIYSWAFELLNAVSFLHFSRIIHRDIKPNNILLDGNSVKLGDFGLSKYFTDLSRLTQNIGTFYYASPQILRNESYSFKTDIWYCHIELPLNFDKSTGCVIYELINLKPFWLVSSSILDDLEDDTLRNLLKAMLQEEENDRANADYLLETYFTINFDSLN